MKDGYLQLARKNGQTRVHRLIAEKALGHSLPEGAEVHHLDGDGRNNRNDNLVICPSMAYHKLLHTRQEALEKAGNANYRKCGICSLWGDPKQMGLYKISKRPNGQPRAFHFECMSQYQRERNAKK